MACCLYILLVYRSMQRKFSGGARWVRLAWMNASMILLEFSFSLIS